MNNRLMLMISAALSQISTILGGIIITRSFTKEMFGTYQQGVLLFSTGSLFAAMGLSKAVYYFSKARSENNHILSNILLLSTLSGIICSIILVIAWGTISHLMGNPDLNPLLIFVIINLLFRTIADLFDASTIISNRIDLLWKIKGAVSILNVAFIIILCRINAPIHWFYILCIFLTSFQVIAVNALASKKSLGIRNIKIDVVLLQEIFKYSFPMLLSIIALYFSRRLDGFLVSIYMDPERFATYSRGALELPIGQIVIFTISSLMMPQFVQLYKQKNFLELSNTFHTEIKRMAILIIPSLFSFFLLAREIIILLYSDRYADSTAVFQIYLLLLPIELYAYNTILQAMNRTIEVFYISIGSVIVNLIISVIGMKSLGMVGPALGVIAASLFSSIACIALINKYIQMPFVKWLPWKFLSLLIAGSGGIFVICRFVKEHLWFGSPIGVIILLLSLSFLLNGILVWFFGFIIKSDKEKIISFILKFYHKISVGSHVR